MEEMFGKLLADKLDKLSRSKEIMEKLGNTKKEEKVEAICKYLHLIEKFLRDEITIKEFDNSKEDIMNLTKSYFEALSDYLLFSKMFGDDELAKDVYKKLKRLFDATKACHAIYMENSLNLTSKTKCLEEMQQVLNNFDDCKVCDEFENFLKEADKTKLEAIYKKKSHTILNKKYTFEPNEKFICQRTNNSFAEENKNSKCTDISETKEEGIKEKPLGFYKFNIFQDKNAPSESEYIKNYQENYKKKDESFTMDDYKTFKRFLKAIQSDFQSNVSSESLGILESEAFNLISNVSEDTKENKE